MLRRAAYATSLIRLASVGALLASAGVGTAQGPTAVGPNHGMGLSQGTASMQFHARAGQPRNAMEYYGLPTAAARGPSGVATPRPSFGTNSTGGRVAGKPFEGTNAGPTLSPYLNLYREQSDEALPNYYAFVRPQQQQNDTNRQQTSDLRQLRRQVQQAQHTTPVAGSVGGRFNNTGRFYQSWQR